MDKDVEENDSVIIFENWILDEGNFFNKIIQFSNILLGHIREVTGGFLHDPHYLNWAAFRAQFRPPPEPPP